VSVVESLAEILAQKIDKETVHLSNIREDDFKIAAMYLIAQVLNVPELEEFANLLLNMKTAKRARNDLLRLARSIRISIGAGERWITREIYKPKEEKESESEEIW